LPVIKKYKFLSDEVYELLKKEILRNNFKHGTRLNDLEISKEMGISRTPVREALQRLVFEGFLEKISGQGYVIKNYEIDDLIEVLQIRKALERLAGDLVIGKITEEQIENLKYIVKKIEGTLKCNGTIDKKKFNEISYDFHNNIFEITNNSRLIELRRNIEEQIRLISTIELNVPQRFHESLEEDKAILNAIISKNKEKAMELSERHVENIIKHIKNDFNENNND
jgi:DNA-binding GntR family transcriptional regulator